MDNFKFFFQEAEPIFGKCCLYAEKSIKKIGKKQVLKPLLDKSH